MLPTRPDIKLSLYNSHNAAFVYRSPCCCPAFVKQTCGIICCGFEKVKLLEEKYLFSNLHEFLFCLHFFTVLLPVHLVCLSHVWKMEASAHTDFTTESLLIRLVLKLNIKHPSISSNSNAAASHSIACLLPVIHETDRSSVHQAW